MTKKHAARAAASDDLERLRTMLRGGPSLVRGTILADDGPIGEPAPMQTGQDGFFAYAAVPSDRDVTVTGVRLEAEVDGETVTAEVRAPAWTAPAGSIAHCFIPDVPGLAQEGE